MSKENAFEALNKILTSAQTIARELELANNLRSSQIGVGKAIFKELKEIKETIQEMEFFDPEEEE